MEIVADLGESIEGKLISVFSDVLKVVNIEQRFETNMTIMNEGPHCDLTDWKHYRSEWQKLKTVKNGQFIGVQYAEDENTKFQEISLDELKKEAKKQCGTEYFNLLKNVKKQTEYPIGISVCRYYLKITGKRNDNGKAFTKLIIVSIPMGC